MADDLRNLSHHVSIEISGVDWDYIIRSLDDIARRLFEHGPDYTCGSNTVEGTFAVASRKDDRPSL